MLPPFQIICFLRGNYLFTFVDLFTSVSERIEGKYFGMEVVSVSHFYWDDTQLRESKDWVSWYNSTISSLLLMSELMNSIHGLFSSHHFRPFYFAGFFSSPSHHPLWFIFASSPTQWKKSEWIRTFHAGASYLVMKKNHEPLPSHVPQSRPPLAPDPSSRSREKNPPAAAITPHVINHSNHP
jgi:hypothetical protein